MANDWVKIIGAVCLVAWFIFSNPLDTKPEPELKRLRIFLNSAVGIMALGYLLLR